MPTSPSLILRHILRATAALLTLVVVSGCATTNSESTSVRADKTSHHITPDSPPIGATAQGIRTLPLIPVIRYDRYTLAELSPSAEQQDLMRQIVDITMPATFNITVGDALRYALLRSGFKLCASPAIHILDTLPLPAADFHVGPLTLASALRLLAGPAWKLEVNELGREVCFVPTSPVSALGASRLFPPKSNDSSKGTGRPTAAAHEDSP